MKRHLPLFLLTFFIASAAHAQFEMGFHYIFSAPAGTMGQNIQPVNSFAVSGDIRLKPFDRKFYLGAELTAGTYAHKTQQETFTSPSDGSLTTTDVDYTSNVCNYHAMAGYDFTKCTALIPYVTMKVGASLFSTDIVIEDPGDHCSCHPIDEKTLFSDVAFSCGAGAGVKVDVNNVLKNWRTGKCYFDFSANYLVGTSIDYVNVKYLDSNNPGPNRYSKTVQAEFVDTNTQEIHDHDVAHVYTSTISLFDFKVGIVKTFGGCR
jgi:hypothetical protein